MVVVVKRLKIEVGKFHKRKVRCDKCGEKYLAPVEKRTDVSIGVKLFRLAFEDKFDRALLLSGDTDQVPAVKAVRECFPGKRVGVLLPLMRVNRELEQAANFSIHIEREHFEGCRLPDPYTMKNGKEITARQNGREFFSTRYLRARCVRFRRLFGLLGHRTGLVPNKLPSNLRAIAFSRSRGRRWCKKRLYRLFNQNVGMIFQLRPNPVSKGKKKDLDPGSPGELHRRNKIRVTRHEVNALGNLAHADPGDIKPDFCINSLLLKVRFVIRVRQRLGRIWNPL